MMPSTIPDMPDSRGGLFPRIVFGLALSIVSISSSISLLLSVNTRIAYDWDYFEALSLVVRSNVFSYSSFPFHNPWVCGGLDILSNPQSRLFSPLILFDVALPPNWSSTLIIVFYTFVGAFSAYVLFRDLGWSRWVAFVGASVFINSSWFGLHVAVGHVPFASMQALPLVGICLLRLSDRKYIILAGLLLALFLLDGGFYTFIFSGFLVAGMLVFGVADVHSTWGAVRRHASTIFVSGIALVLLSAVKVVPVLVASAGRAAQVDDYNMPTRLIAKALFWPAQGLGEVESVRYEFHEYGTYLSLILIALIATASVLDRSFLRRNWKLLAAILFWFWTGTSLLWPVNPWAVFHSIPLLNVAHVPSRTFLLMHLFFILLAGNAFSNIFAAGKAGYAVGMLILMEALFVKNYTLAATGERVEANMSSSLIASQTIENTTSYAWRPEHYLEPNIGSATCYEPSFFPYAIRSSDSPLYRGEVFYTGTSYTAPELVSYRPGHIRVRYDTYVDRTIEFNTNALWGWRVIAGEAIVSGLGPERLRARVPAGAGELELQYRPYLLPWLLAAYLFGAALFLRQLFGRMPRRSKTAC
jgi:hypothetical protein